MLPTSLALGAQDEANVPSFEDVLSLESVGGVEISPDGERVAYTVRSTDWDENGYDTEIWIAAADGDSFQLTRTADGSSMSPRWSPDGTQIAYVRQPDSQLLSFQHSDIYVLDMASGESRGLVVGDGSDSGPEWSPDGQWIAFRVDPDGAVWVRGFVRAWENVARWTIFSADGTWLGTIEMPESFTVTDIGLDYVLGSWLDEQGTEYVRRYVLQRES